MFVKIGVDSVNNENNNINNIQPVVVPTTEPVVVPSTEVPVVNPTTEAPVIMPSTEPAVQPVQPAVDKFMTVSDINQINQPATQPVVSALPTVEPTTEAPVVVPSSEPQLVTDNNTMVNENLKKVEIKDYTPPSKLKVTLLIIFFIGLVAFIIFLPNISSMISNYKSGVSYQKEEKVTTGELICSLSTNTKDLDKEYEVVFTFIDSKLTRDKFITTTRGDSTTEGSLDELNEKCTNLKSESEGIDGFSIRCDYTDNKLIETQSFNLETIDTEKLDAAFTEAGGMLPSYQFNQDIDGIEKNMKASGYTCERQK
jgi:uncharacterized lipoprotein YehR (DUF1307 family)